MSADQQPIWYGVYGKEYQGPEPAFLDDDFPWVAELKASFPAIREALAPLMADGNDELKSHSVELLHGIPQTWKTIGFCFWGRKNYIYLARFPVIADLLNRIPGLVTVSLNMLEPHSQIKPHYGETNAAYRVHLGIKIPASLPACGFTVNGESRSWEEGGVLVFMDSNWHEAFNNSDERRYILLLDILRPEYVSKKKQICVNALSAVSLYHVFSLIPHFPGEAVRRDAHKIPQWVIDGVILLPFKIAWSIYWSVYMKFGLGRLIFRLFPYLYRSERRRLKRKGAISYEC